MQQYYEEGKKDSKKRGFKSIQFLERGPTDNA